MVSQLPTFLLAQLSLTCNQFSITTVTLDVKTPGFSFGVKYSYDLGEDPASRGVDDVHEELGAQWLAERFGPDVSEPVRLHVAAKRYLCSTESDYFGKLAPDSVRSLELQGGLMSAGEIEEFRRNPHWQEAVRLRRYDEMAKDPRASTPDFDHFLSHVPACRK